MAEFINMFIASLLLLSLAGFAVLTFISIMNNVNAGRRPRQQLARVDRQPRR